MTYIGLARKWRPQKFSELVGQAPIARTLENAIKLGRVSHALLLTGSRGVGKTTTARILAKGLNCEKGPTTEPCGECSNCREIAAGMSVDVLEVDGASNTKVDEIRDLLENVQYRPSKSKHKIYIIDEVHMLSTHSFNALLKTLEEPPPGVIFIFATTEPQKIPDTIHSRCQRFDFRQISEEQMISHLKKIVTTEKVEISQASLSLIARQAAGGLRDALSLLDQVVAFCGDKVPDAEVVSILGLTDRKLIDQTLDAFVSYNSDLALQTVNDVFEKGFDAKSYLLEVWNRVRDLLVLKQGGSADLVKGTAEDKAKLKTMSAGVAGTEFERWFDLLKFLTYDVGRAEFPRYLMEVTYLKITRKPAETSLSTLVGRLEALEGRVAKGGGYTAAPSASTPVAVSTSASVPASAPAPKPVFTGDKWDALVQAVKKKKPSMAAALLQSSKSSVSDSVISLGFEDGSFNFSRAKEPEFQSLLTGAAAELFGSSYSVAVESLPKMATPTATNAQADKAREKEALENPIVQRAVSLFEARIDQVKPTK